MLVRGSVCFWQGRLEVNPEVGEPPELELCGAVTGESRVGEDIVGHEVILSLHCQQVESQNTGTVWGQG